MKVKTSIRRRFIIVCICLAIGPLLLMGLALSWQSYVLQKEQIVELQQELTVQGARNISSFWHEVEQKIEFIVNSYDLAVMSPDELHLLLSRFLLFSQDSEHGNIYNQISFLDAEGLEIINISRTHVSRIAQQTDRSHSQEYLTPFLKGITYYSPVYFNKITLEPLMKVAIPLRDIRTLAFQGVLTAEVRLKSMWDIVAGIKIGENGTAYLVDSGNRVVVHKNPSIVLKNTIYSIPSQPSVAKGIQNEKALVTVRKIELGDQYLYFVAERPFSEAFHYFTNSVIYIVFILIIALLAACFLSVIFIRQIVRPIESLALTAKEIGAGDYLKKADTSRTDEIGELAKAFNTMTAQLVNTFKAYEKEKNFVHSAIESLTVPFYVIDANDYTIKLANSAAGFGPLTEQSKCYSLSHGVNVPCNGVDHPCMLQEVKRAKKAVIIEHVHGGGDTPLKIYEIYGYPIFNDKGEIAQVIEYNVDITERKRLEERVRQSHKLEAIGSLAGGIAHDFSNLLTIVIGYCEMGIASVKQDDPVQNNLENILDAAERATALTQQLLAFSRKQVLEVKIVNLNTVISRMLKMLNRLLEDNITLNFNQGKSLFNIKADPGKLDQVFVNLAVNARDAMTAGGSLLIETANFIVDQKYAQYHENMQPGPYVSIIFVDTGVGMSKEVIDKIFDPFFTTKSHGTGLGLATLYGIIKQHNGFITVESELGKGSTFKVLFPAVSEEEEQQTVFDKTIEEKGSETVMVIDDEPTILQMVGDSLEPLGYNVLKASSGEEAVEMISEYKEVIHLLLSDIVMKGMTGPQAVEIIKEKRSEVKVIYMSGYPEHHISGRGVVMDGASFMQKPLRASQLSRKVREVLDKDHETV